MDFLPSDRRALIIVFFLFIGIWSSILLYDHFIGNNAGTTLAEATAIDSIETQLGHSSEGQPYRHDNRRGNDAPQHGMNDEKAYFAQPTQVAETFPFDPNTADSTTLLRLGLPAWMVRNIYKYRAKGGRYHEAYDFKRTYGMTGELWKRIGPMIRIGDDYQLLAVEGHTRTTKKDDNDSSRSMDGAARQRFPEKFKEPVRLDLNRTDTNELRRIPGIGPVYARRIVRYREQLGGFTSVAQLAEIPDLPEGIEQWFSAPASGVRTINVNKADFKTLRRHPYMNYMKAAAIANQRRQNGPLKSIDDLRRMPEFTADDLQRLAPYLSF